MKARFDLNNPYAQAFIDVGKQMGASPAFISASLGNSWNESKWNPSERTGDGGAAYGGMQWNSKYSPDRVQALMATAKQMGLPWDNPRVQATHWYNENKDNLGVADPNAAVNAAVSSLRPAGYQPGHPEGAKAYDLRKNDSLEIFNQLNGGNGALAYSPQEQTAAAAGGSMPLQEQTLIPGTQQEDRYSGVGPALANIGSIVAGLDRGAPRGLSVGLANAADNLVAQQRLNQQNKGLRVLSANDKGMITQDPNTGEVKVQPLPTGYAENKLQYKGLDTDKSGQTFDTFVNPTTGELVRKPTNMQDPAMKAQEKLDEGDANFWGEYVMTNPAALTQVPRNVRSQVMSSVRKQAEEAGFGGKDLFSTLQKNATDIVDYKKRAGIIANLDTFKGEFLGAAKQAADYSKDLERQFGSQPLNQLYQWAEKNAGSPEAVKINNLKTALEAVSRSANRAFSTASGGNVTGEQRLTELMNPAMPHSMITGSLGVLTKDVVRLNQNARYALDNQRARNGGKPIPHPEIDNEEAALKDILGGYDTKDSGKQPMIRGDAPANPEDKNAIPMPSRITSPADFDAYVRENKIPPGTPFRMGDRVIYSK
jgi:hypothetical protein